MFVKDPQRAVKDYLAEHGSGGVTRVMGLSKLKKRYGTHESRRELLRSYDLFLVDDRIVPSMPKLLGNHFIRAKKMPLTVRMNRAIPGAIERAISSTSFACQEGTCTAVHIGKTAFTEQQIVENAHMALEGVSNALPRGWNDIQSVHIKTHSSMALPIYVALPSERLPPKHAVPSDEGKKASNP